MAFAVVGVAVLCCWIGLGAAQQAARASSSTGKAAVGSEVDLERVLKSTIAGGDVEVDRQLLRIQSKMAIAFQAMSKNMHGRVSPEDALYLLQSYFVQVHGWTIDQDAATASLEMLIEKRGQFRGFSLTDMAIVALLSEKQASEEVGQFLESAYHLNRYSKDMPMNESTLERVLASYLVLLTSGENERAFLLDGKQDSAFEQQAGFSFMSDMAKDVLLNFRFKMEHMSNPGHEAAYSFGESKLVASMLNHELGRQHSESCRQKRRVLVDLDQRASGKVSLSNFYSHVLDGGSLFEESVEYLDRTSILDDRFGHNPKVRIPNYIAGPASCTSSLGNLSLCCVSECSKFRNRLEAGIQGPLAEPELILALLGDLDSSSVEVPRHFPTEMVHELEALVDSASEAVDLRSQAFAKWLHLAFPHECPYPHAPGAESALSASYWRGKSYLASAEERAKYVMDSDRTEHVPEAEGNPRAARVQEEHDRFQSPLKFKTIRNVLRVVSQLAMSAAVLHAARRGWSRAWAAISGASDENGKKGM